MTNRWVRELLGLAGIIIPGVIGTVVVGRTLSTYWGRDVQASVIVATIGIALLVGLAELITRQLRAARLDNEVRALPARPNDSTLDIASPLLSTFLRARLEHLPLPTLGEGIAPFLTGLLVMLGLLGTLLGLFQTVHGAGHALTSATDVEALRRSLGAPIAGLTRSFGCSAAGISASAMLGLALALVRRREVFVVRAIHAYASGPLRAQSPLARQARALEQLVSQGLNQGNALPDAAGVLSGVGDKLGDVSKQIVELQREALKSQQSTFTELLASLRDELIRSTGESGQALIGTLRPVVEQLANKSAEALATQADVFASVARELKTELAHDAQERRKDTAEALRGLRAQLDEAEQARAAAHTNELEKLSELAARSLTEAERREAELSERWSQQLHRLDAQLEATRSSEAERLHSLDEQLSVVSQRDGARVAELDNLVNRVGSELTQLSEQLGAQLLARAEHEREHNAQTLLAATQLTAAACALDAHAEKQQASFEQSAAEQKATLERLVEHLPVLFEQAARSSQAAAQEAVSQLAALTEQRLSHVSQLMTDDIEARSNADRTLAERNRSAFEALTQQSADLAGLLERTEQLLPQLSEAAHAGAAETLARMTQHMETQATRFAAIETALEQGRHEQVESLAQQVHGYAQELEQKLAQTTEAVHEAAAIWQASSAEMQAVARLFAQSIERQREASDAWIESLGEVEGAVERAGQTAAHDALSDQLAATQEVFARQLQFQRELFEQLRALRSGTSPSRVTHGEADVPV